MKNIPIIKTYKQKDIFPAMADLEVEFKDRITGKSIILDDNNNLALVGTTVNHIYTLPGGGIDSGESVEDGIIREAKEETGCDIEVVNILGIIDDYRNRDRKHCISYCAVAKLLKKGEHHMTEEEIKNGLHVKWVTISEARGILLEENKKVKNGQINFYNTAYNIVRDYEFLLKLDNKQGQISSSVVVKS